MIIFLPQPMGTVRLGDYLRSHLQQENWTHFRAAVAFVKHSGVRHISRELAEFSRRASIKISVGIDCGGTSMEGLRDLLENIGNCGELWVYHNENSSTFHPKVYLFKNDSQADILIGSGNLTEGGLFTNYEASFSISLDLTSKTNVTLLQNIENTLDEWSHLAPGTALILTHDILNQLIANGDVPTEAQSRGMEESDTHVQAVDRVTRISMFPRIAVPRAPILPRETPDEPENLGEESFEVEKPEPAPCQPGFHTGFVMTLQRTDVGIGQTTAGTSRRSPEIFIPLAARDFDPDFWGWPHSFTADSNKPGKTDRQQVSMRIGADIIQVNMMTWPDKHDFRIRSESLRSAGLIGDILRIERSNGERGFSYYVEIIPQATTQYAHYLSLCANPVRNSVKRWGYY